MFHQLPGIVYLITGIRSKLADSKFEIVVCGFVMEILGFITEPHNIGSTSSRHLQILRHQVLLLPLWALILNLSSMKYAKVSGTNINSKALHSMDEDTMCSAQVLGSEHSLRLY